MALHLIIDGYNLLGARGQGPGGGLRELEPLREALIQELARYRQTKAHPVTVVFDGWQAGLGAERREHRSGVEVVYSRRGERADQVIRRLVEGYGRDCAVVSSDREVADHARARGAFVIAAWEFDARLRAAPVPPGRFPAKGAEPGDERPVRRNPEKKGNPRKLPKAVRKRNRMLGRF